VNARSTADGNKQEWTLGFDVVASRVLLASDAPFHRFGLT